MKLIVSVIVADLDLPVIYLWQRLEMVLHIDLLLLLLAQSLWCSLLRFTWLFILEYVVNVVDGIVHIEVLTMLLLIQVQILLSSFAVTFDFCNVHYAAGGSRWTDINSRILSAYKTRSKLWSFLELIISVSLSSTCRVAQSWLDFSVFYRKLW